MEFCGVWLLTVFVAGTHTQPTAQQIPASNVPIPENYDRRTQEYPRPQEAEAAVGGLEGELHQGMDVMRQ